MAIFGQGNSGISAQQINNFLARPTLTSDDILNEAQRSGVSLEQIRAAAPNDPRFQDANVMPFLESRGIYNTNAAPTMATGLAGSEQALQGGLSGGLDALTQGINQGRADFTTARNDVNNGINLGVQKSQAFSEAGDNAIARMAALSGALGNGEQGLAFDQYQQSPGQQFLRERGEQALLRNSSAVGGLGGGRVLAELQRQGIGEAAQSFGQDFDRLGTVAGAGLNAIGQQGNLLATGAGLNANIGINQANQSFNAGNLGANMALNTGNNLAAGRTRAGELIANNVNNTTSALTALLQNQGSGIASMLGQNAGNLAGVINQGGQQQEASQQSLAQLIAQLSAQENNSLTNVKPLTGQLNSALDAAGKVSSGIGAAFG